MTQSFVRTDTLIGEINHESNSGFNGHGSNGEQHKSEQKESGSAGQKAAETYRDKFFRSIMDQSRDYPLPIPIISIVQNGEEIPFLTLKSFSLWQGKQKSKKTTVLALAVASFIRSSHNNEDAVYFSSTAGGKVLFFDNEQGESYAARTMRLILKLAGLGSSPKLIYCDLREFSPTERKEIIKAGIECTEDVRMVVIDGLVDLLNDFMDAQEGHLTTTDILKLCSAYNVHIAGVLHQNKNDKNARAHIGTISSQKCEVEVSTEVDSDDRSKSLVSCLNSRGLPFEPFSIKWEKGSLPFICQEFNSTGAVSSINNKTYQRSKEIAEHVFKPLSALTYTESITGIMNDALKSESTAKRLMKDLLSWGIVLKSEDGLYRIKDDKGSRVHEGSKKGS